MSPSRAIAALLLLVSFLAAPSCAPRGKSVRSGAGAPLVGVYKTRLEDSEGALHRFRLLLFAELPDRFHAEVLTPLGATRMIVDGGEQRLAVTLVPERISYVGAARSESLEPILGIRIALEELVRGLISGETGGGGYTMRRSGDTGSLPERLEIRTGSAGLVLTLKRMRRLGADPRRLGSGRPPEGTEVRPLDQLRRETALPAIDPQDGGS